MHKPIQVVDKSGKFIGLADSPFTAIEKEQIRLLARVVITDGEGRFLLQKRAEDMRMYPGRWDTAAAGHVDEGETPQQTAYRELEEEIGMVDTVLKEINQYYDSLFIQYYNMTFRSYSYVFQGMFKDETANLKLAKDEVAAVKWFKQEEIMKLIDQQPELCTDGLIKIFGARLI